MEIKISPKQFPSDGSKYGDQNITKTIRQCDGYVKYEEAEVDRLVAILKTNNCGDDGGGGGGPCRIQ